MQLKHLLTTAPITVFPNFNLPFRLYTDAAALDQGAILAQVQDGQESIIYCALTSENNYPETKLGLSHCLAHKETPTLPNVQQI